MGLLDEAADSEIDRYPCSRTKASVGRVKSFLDAIERLRKASAAPAIEEFDLTDLVVRIAADEAAQGRAILDNLKVEAADNADIDDDAEENSQPTVIKLSLARRDPVITTGDPALIEMAVANALRNAIEAFVEIEVDDRSDVILNWGVTDTDSWIVVLDERSPLPFFINSDSKGRALSHRTDTQEQRPVKLRPIFVEVLPEFETIKDGELWISHKHRTINLRCPCGCGELTVLTLHPSRWHVCFDGKSVSLDGPTGGSVWAISGCGSHYVIRKNNVIWGESIHPDRQSEYAEVERARMLRSTSSPQTLRSRLRRLWRGLSMGNWRK